MRLFNCSVCGNLLYFENVSCTQCGHALGFVPGQMSLIAINADANAYFAVPGTQTRFKKCANYQQYQVCNWLVAETDQQNYCRACRLNHTIPNLSVEGNQALWQIMEKEKRRLVYSLMQLQLPLVSKEQDKEKGLSFSFLSDAPCEFSERNRVKTGHDQGHITINLAEADPVQRERMRSQMAEPYRTILGHFRHESGHYYWDRLIANGPLLQQYRALFGDESANYTDALNQHYQQGPPANWPDNYVSSYASSHPWEDWAESWAHYLHIVDTLETAYQFNLHTRPRAANDQCYKMDVDANPYTQANFQAIIDHWLPLTYALNSLNRSMGHSHIYPFVLSPTIIEKLAFVHRVIKGHA
ncbi:putative zinc-binding peptidase [Aliiglaciecola sp. CAU 1673]|uniref:zinc-binding metallopeptidase family protein n=1 Tax=Aliiglaciecola sp. CAU 1673 TaxID=3032595 RepID=UPI0023DA0EEA|nr:putative zinc-binding peptidase [Aliiglaciecola sp. CAU 1673]MDF2180141.1 putative zinc-binding peptidase [Aliiglaciecola sp. CAU 1673]